MLHSIWLKSVINLKPKASNKDLFVPVKRVYYRLWVKYFMVLLIVFSGIINHRIVDYCESNNVYEDEQNGFRCKRSCEDHIYKLTLIIRNRLLHNQSTHCYFIDMQNHFTG